MLVELIDLDHKRCVLCRECEVIWEGEEPQESGPIIRFEEYMNNFGKVADWKRLVKLAGVYPGYPDAPRSSE
jgi:Fe-S-cluster-containing dehydrogenase component